MLPELGTWLDVGQQWLCFRWKQIAFPFDFVTGSTGGLIPWSMTPFYLHFAMYTPG